MCPKKAKTLADLIAILSGVVIFLWIKDKNFRRKFNDLITESLKELAKDVEKSSDKNIIKSASTVGNSAKEKSVLKGKSVKQ